MALVVLVCWTGLAQAQAILPLFASRPGAPPQFVEITVAGGRPAPVSVDTGSVGLYLMERDVGPGVERTDTTIHQGYVDGTRFEGYMGLATIGFPGAGVATDVKVPVGVITRVYCAADRPNCPGSADKPGVMGVGLSTAGRLPSPFALLPGRLRSGFIYDARPGVRPHITLGLTPENTRDFRFAACSLRSPGRTGCRPGTPGPSAAATQWMVGMPRART